MTEYTRKTHNLMQYSSKVKTSLLNVVLPTLFRAVKHFEKCGQQNIAMLFQLLDAF